MFAKLINFLSVSHCGLNSNIHHVWPSPVTERMRPSGGVGGGLFGMSFSHNALNTLGGLSGGSLNGSLNSNSSMSSSWGNSPTEQRRPVPTFGTRPAPPLFLSPNGRAPFGFAHQLPARVCVGVYVRV